MSSVLFSNRRAKPKPTTGLKSNKPNLFLDDEEDDIFSTQEGKQSPSSSSTAPTPGLETASGTGPNKASPSTNTSTNASASTDAGNGTGGSTGSSKVGQNETTARSNAAAATAQSTNASPSKAILKEKDDGDVVVIEFQDAKKSTQLAPMATASSSSSSLSTTVPSGAKKKATLLQELHDSLDDMEVIKAPRATAATVGSSGGTSQAKRESAGKNAPVPVPVPSTSTSAPKIAPTAAAAPAIPSASLAKLPMSDSFCMVPSEQQQQQQPIQQQQQQQQQPPPSHSLPPFHDADMDMDSSEDDPLSISTISDGVLIESAHSSGNDHIHLSSSPLSASSSLLVSSSSSSSSSLLSSSSSSSSHTASAWPSATLSSGGAGSALSPSLRHAALGGKFTHRGACLTREVWRSMLDADGRVLDDAKVRQIVFRGGLEPTLRSELWPFLFGLYLFNSTFTERQIVQREKYAQYYSMRRRCIRELGALTASALPAMQSPAAGTAAVESDEAAAMSDPSVAVLAEVYANSKPFRLQQLKRSQVQIDKDVPRTDRDQAYYSGPLGEAHSRKLRQILLTYAAFQSQVGYVQGMSDVLSLILMILDDEAAAYWCFVGYMRNVEYDFQEAGMSWKLQRMSALLQFMDPTLYAFFKKHEAHELVFCHRWLLLSFRREFPVEQAIQLFEVLNAKHIGKAVISHRSSLLGGSGAASATTASSSTAPAAAASLLPSKARSGASGGAAGDDTDNQDSAHYWYTFELFVALAIIEANRSKLLKCSDVSEIYGYINSIANRIDLELTLADAERLYLSYRMRTSQEVQRTNETSLWQLMDDGDYVTF